MKNKIAALFLVLIVMACEEQKKGHDMYHIMYYPHTMQALDAPFRIPTKDTYYIGKLHFDYDNQRIYLEPLQTKEDTLDFIELTKKNSPICKKKV